MEYTELSKNFDIGEMVMVEETVMLQRQQQLENVQKSME